MKFKILILLTAITVCLSSMESIQFHRCKNNLHNQKENKGTEQLDK